MSVTLGSSQEHDPAKHALTLAALVDGAQVTMFKGCRHHLHVEQPDLFAQAVRRFLDAPKAAADMASVSRRARRPAHDCGGLRRRPFSGKASGATNSDFHDRRSTKLLALHGGFVDADQTMAAPTFAREPGSRGIDGRCLAGNLAQIAQRIFEEEILSPPVEPRGRGTRVEPGGGSLVFLMMCESALGLVRRRLSVHPSTSRARVARAFEGSR